MYVELPELGDRASKPAKSRRGRIGEGGVGRLRPVAGKVVAVNAALADKPETINEDPYGDGWIFLIQPDRPRRAQRTARRGRLRRAARRRRPLKLAEGAAGIHGYFGIRPLVRGDSRRPGSRSARLERMLGNFAAAVHAGVAAVQGGRFVRWRVTGTWQVYFDTNEAITRVAKDAGWPAADAEHAIRKVVTRNRSTRRRALTIFRNR